MTSWSVCCGQRFNEHLFLSEWCSILYPVQDSGIVPSPHCSGFSCSFRHPFNFISLFPSQSFPHKHGPHYPHYNHLIKSLAFLQVGKSPWPYTHRSWKTVVKIAPFVKSASQNIFFSSLLFQRSWDEPNKEQVINRFSGDFLRQGQVVSWHPESPYDF